MPQLHQSLAMIALLNQPNRQRQLQDSFQFRYREQNEED
jgi:hypothetical protein